MFVALVCTFGFLFSVFCVFILSCLSPCTEVLILYVFVQFYRPFPLGVSPTAVNKYLILCIIPYHTIHHIMSYHIVSYIIYIISRYIISYHIISYIIVSCRIILYHTIHHVISYRIISYISYHVITYHVISYHHIMYHIVSYRILYHHIISYIISCHIISYQRICHESLESSNISLNNNNGLVCFMETQCCLRVRKF
jgi:hypothetical protein